MWKRRYISIKKGFRWNTFVIAWFSRRNFYPEWPHSQCGCLACWRLQGCKIESRLWLSCTDLYHARGAQGVLPMKVGGATSQSDLPSLTPLSVADCGGLKLGVPHRATSVEYSKELIIDPTFCGSRFSSGRLLAIEDFTFLMSQLSKCFSQPKYNSDTYISCRKWEYVYKTKFRYVIESILIIRCRLH